MDEQQQRQVFETTYRILSGEIWKELEDAPWSTPDTSHRNNHDGLPLLFIDTSMESFDDNQSRPPDNQEAAGTERQLASEEPGTDVFDQALESLLLFSKEGKATVPKELATKFMAVPFLTPNSDISLNVSMSNGGTVLKDITGLNAQIPIPEELLAKFGATKEAAIDEVVLGAPINGNRPITIKLKDGPLKEVSLMADMHGQPVLRDGKMEILATVTVNDDQTVKCGIRIGKGDQNREQVSIQIYGAHSAKAAFVQKLGIPGEFADIAKLITQVDISDGKIGIKLSEPSRINVNGLSIELASNVAFERLPSRSANIEKFNVDGISVGGVDFGNELKGTSRSVNSALVETGALPITLRTLQFQQRADGRQVMSFRSDGAVVSGTILLEGKEKPDFLCCEMDVKHPIWSGKTFQIRADRNGLIDPINTLKRFTTIPLEEGAKYALGFAEAAKNEVLATAGRIQNDPKGTIDSAVRDSKAAINKAKDLASDTVDTGAKVVDRNARPVIAFLNQAAPVVAPVMFPVVRFVKRVLP